MHSNPLPFLRAGMLPVECPPRSVDIGSMGAGRERYQTNIKVYTETIKDVGKGEVGGGGGLYEQVGGRRERRERDSVRERERQREKKKRKRRVRSVQKEIERERDAHTKGERERETRNSVCARRGGGSRHWPSKVEGNGREMRRARRERGVLLMKEHPAVRYMDGEW